MSTNSTIQMQKVSMKKMSEVPMKESVLSIDDVLRQNLDLKTLSTLPIEKVKALAEKDPRPEFLALLDAAEMAAQIAEFKENILNSDWVCIVITCCDSRVVLPSHLVEIADEEGTKNAHLLSLPTIGSGAPSRMRLAWSIEELFKLGVSADKIKIIVTQHGDTEEITAAHSKVSTPEVKCTCGLRAVLQQTKSVVTDDLRYRFDQWVYGVKQEVGLERGSAEGLVWAPDRASLEELETRNPSLMAEIKIIADALHIPRRLLLRILHRNADSDIAKNERMTYQKVRAAIIEKFPELWPAIKIYSAYYNHNSKEMVFPAEKTERLGADQVVDLTALSPEIKLREVNYQDPDYVVISFGQRVISMPPELLLSHLSKGCADTSLENAGNWLSDNFFTTNASDGLPALFCGMAEASYAVSHSGLVAQHGDHAQNPNFAHLKKLVIICDDEKQANVVKGMTATREYKEDFAPLFGQIKDLLLINLNLDAKGNPGKTTVETVALPAIN